MTTPVAEQTPSPAVPAPGPSRRRIAALTGIAAAVIALAIGIAVATSGGSGAKPTLALTLPEGGPGRTCIQFSTDLLAQSSDAFAGTVTAVSDSSVTLSVTHWYKAGGAKADVVTIATGTSLPFLGVQFDQGGDYLVSATDGHVDGCGFSGPATADLRAAFTAAFGG